ncbi:hypothetical protein LP420_17330 [Massilia sp. B-10]|nr:hypothetical protein LP420_17330 [Massilia sp. B-10]
MRFEGEQPKGLRQNQRVTARLLIEEKPNVILVPRGPFVESEGGRFAYVVRDSIAVRTPDHAGRDQRRQCRNYVRRAAGRQACDFRYRHVRQCGASPSINNHPRKDTPCCA